MFMTQQADLFEQALRVHQFCVKLDWRHAFRPVGIRGSGHVACEAERKRSGLLSVFVRDAVCVLGVGHRRKKVLLGDEIIVCTCKINDIEQTHVIFVGHQRLDTLYQSEPRRKVQTFPMR